LLYVSTIMKNEFPKQTTMMSCFKPIIIIFFYCRCCSCSWFAVVAKFSEEVGVPPKGTAPLLPQAAS
jgi:hypothetical protein